MCCYRISAYSTAGDYRRIIRNEWNFYEIVFSFTLKTYDSAIVNQTSGGVFPALASGEIDFIIGYFFLTEARFPHISVVSHMPYYK